MPKPLATYRAKRDFARTREPRGVANGAVRVARGKRLRFVIQKHAASRLHYDLRLEWKGLFRSWAVTRGPSCDPADKRLAVEVEDHPLAYGDFEGSIPKGQYGGGTVMVWDRGYWTPDGDAAAMLRKGDLKFALAGKKLHGGWALIRMRKGRFGDGSRNYWLLIKHRDRYAQEGVGDAILKLDRSAASGRDMDAIAAGRGRAPTPFMVRKESKQNRKTKSPAKARSK